MSRAFGNRMLKQFVVAEPEIQVIINIVVGVSLMYSIDCKRSHCKN